MIKVLPLAGLMGLLSLSCASECTDMGCLSGLDVELRPPVDGSGVSSLKVRLDNAEIACSVAPEANCDGARLSWEGGQLRAISVDKVRPEQVEIQLLQGDEVVRSATFTPTYVAQYPNGTDCPAACERSQLVLGD